VVRIEQVLIHCPSAFFHPLAMLKGLSHARTRSKKLGKLWILPDPKMADKMPGENGRRE